MPFVDTLAPRARVVGIMSKIIRDGEAEAMCNVSARKRGAVQDEVCTTKLVA